MKKSNIKVYFAHSRADYNTEFENKAATYIIGKSFPEFDHLELLNPNRPEHQEGCNGSMQYFLDLVEGCDALVYTRMPDGRIGAGVAAEIRLALAKHMPVKELDRGLTCMWTVRHIDSNNVLSVQDTKTMLALFKELKEHSA